MANSSEPEVTLPAWADEQEEEEILQYLTDIDPDEEIEFPSATSEDVNPF